MEKYFLVKPRLEKIFTENAQGVNIIRSRCQLKEEGECNSKYFLSLEKHNYDVKYIKSLVVYNQTIRDPGEVIFAQKDFYLNIYSDIIQLKIMSENSCLKYIRPK